MKNKSAKTKEVAEVVTPSQPVVAEPHVVDAKSLQTPPVQNTALRMPPMNDVKLTGRLTRDAQVRSFNNRTVVNFDIASEEKYKNGQNEWAKKVTFVPIAIWGQAADRVKDSLKKGAPVLVAGRLRSNTFELSDGSKRTKMQVEAYSVQSLAKGQSQSKGQEIGD
jgi:single-strand DNA-binding protein